MPPRPGPNLLVEPWVDADDISVAPARGATAAATAARAGREQWVEFTVGLVGDAVSSGARAAAAGPRPALGAAGAPSRGRPTACQAPPPCLPPHRVPRVARPLPRALFLCPIHALLACSSPQPNPQRSPSICLSAPRRARQNSMRAMTPSAVARAADGGRHYLTPPPASVLPGGITEAVQFIAAEMVEHLGIRWAGRHLGSGARQERRAWRHSVQWGRQRCARRRRPSRRSWGITGS
jgi:hypothetical protein